MTIPSNKNDKLILYLSNKKSLLWCMLRVGDITEQEYYTQADSIEKAHNFLRKQKLIQLLDSPENKQLEKDYQELLKTLKGGF